MRSSIENAIEFTFPWEVRTHKLNLGLSSRTPKITLEDAIELYRKEYWNPLRCDDLDWPLACAVFDTAVDCGIGNAKRWLDWSRKDNNYDLNYFLNLRVLRYLDTKKNPTGRKDKKVGLARTNDLKKYIEINSTC